MTYGRCPTGSSWKHFTLCHRPMTQNNYACRVVSRLKYFHDDQKSYSREQQALIIGTYNAEGWHTLSLIKSALILGASGLVGRQLLQQLLDDPRYASVTCLVRRPLAKQQYRDPHNKLQPVVIDFEDPESYQGYFTVDHVYCCLGTTLKRAGNT